MTRNLAALLVALLCQTARSDEVAGVWKGRWIDERTGHSGPLRSTIRCGRCGDYRATFTGRFAGVIPFRFSSPLEVAGHGDGVAYLAGEHRLGLGLFGRFRYSAVVGGGSFESDYSSGRWTGKFSMQRVR